MKLVFSQMQKNALEAWRRSVDDQVARTEVLLGRVAEKEAQGEVATHLAVDEWSRLVKETLRFQLELSGQWRKQSLDAMQKLFSLGIAPRAEAEPGRSGR